MKKDKDNYSTLFYFSPLPNLVYDLLTFEILDINQAAIVLYGYNREDFLRLSIKDLTEHEEISKLLIVHSQIDTNEANIYFGIFTHKKKNGESVRIEINGHKVEFQDRKSIVIVCQDVTEKELQLRDLRESKKKLKAASTIAKLGYWKLELDANTLSWSDEVYNIWGRSKTDFVVNYENFHQTIHPDDQDLFEFEQSISFSGEKEHDFAHRIILPDGSIRWVHELGRLVKDKNGKSTVFEGIVRDVTLQKEEEQRFKLLESVITNANDAVLITETESFVGSGSKIVYVNEAFTRMTGYSSDEVIGETPIILQGKDTDTVELVRLNEAIQNIKSCEATLLNYKKNGEGFWVNIFISPLINDKGFCTHWIAIERDVTEQKNRELEQNLLSQISLIFNNENNLNDASQKLCDVFAAFGNFDLAEIWLPNIENTQIQLINYSKKSHIATEFYKKTLEIKSLNLGEGLPGTVWETKQTILWTDIQNKDTFIRKNAAKKAGITSLLGMPLLFRNQVVGVFVIGSEKKADKLSQYSKIFHHLETFIGSEINRKKLENELNYLFEALPDIICLADFKGRFLKMNKAGCLLLGYEENEILYESFDKFIHPDDKDASANELKRLSEGETVFKFENRYITKKKEVIWLSWTCNTGLKEGVIYASAKDITTEKRLKELNRQANSIAKIGSWEIDVIHNKLYWSDMVHELHETDSKSYSPDFERALNFYKKDFKEQIKEQLLDCIENGKSCDFEAVIVTAQKKERWVRVIGKPEMLGNKCVRFYGSFQDISDKKDAENRLQSLADNLPGVVFQYLIYPDGSDSLKYVSKGSKLVWGIAPEDCMKDTNNVWNQIKAGGDYEEVKMSILDSKKNKTKWTYGWKYVMPDGEVKRHIGYGAPSFFSDGKVVFNSMILDVTEEKKLEDLLAQASSLAKIGSWEVDLTTGETFWSDMVHQIHETDPKSFIPDFGSSISFFREDFLEMTTRSIENCMSTGNPFNFEAIIVTAKKNERWVRGIGNAEIVNGKSKRLYGSFQDIHTTKVLDLQFSEILGSISDAFYAVDSNWNFTFFNKEAEKLLDRKKVDLIGQNIWKEFPSALETPLQEIYYKVAQSGQSESFEYFFPGNEKWYEINAYPSNGGVSSYFKNIDERKRTAEIIKKTSEEKTMILESIGDAFFTMDKNFIVTYWNKKAEELVFTNRETIVGKNLLDVFPSAIDLPSYKFYSQVLQTREAVVFEDFFADKYFEVNAYPSEKGITVFFRDISQRKLQEVELKEANESLKKYANELELSNEQLEQFAFIASHDLQEPLRMITSFMNQLERKYGSVLDKKAHEYIYFATDGAKRMKQIILDLLEYSRAGKFEEKKEMVNIIDLIEDYKTLRRKIISEKSVIINFSNLPAIEAHRVPLIQTLHCLLDNAIKYTFENVSPIIELRLEDKGEDWLFVIKDNGIGIADQFFNKIFIIFQRLHNRDEYNGTGIGLAIAKKHIESWGGKIWLESELNKGTIFYFTLPKDEMKK